MRKLVEKRGREEEEEKVEEWHGFKKGDRIGHKYGSAKGVVVGGDEKRVFAERDSAPGLIAKWDADVVRSLHHKFKEGDKVKHTKSDLIAEFMYPHSLRKDRAWVQGVSPYGGIWLLPFTELEPA